MLFQIQKLHKSFTIKGRHPISKASNHSRRRKGRRTVEIHSIVLEHRHGEISRYKGASVIVRIERDVEEDDN